MITRKSFFAGIVIAAALFSVSAYSAWWSFSKEEDQTASLPDATEIEWQDLVPDDFVPPENPYITMSQEEIDKLMDGSEESNAEVARITEELSYAPVVSELDGKRIKLPAYITPLEYDGSALIKEFLLVPYVGACIHVPPPPANQIVHAESRKAVKFNGMYEPVWAIGTIRAETITSELAESGYRLDVEQLLPYSQK